MTDEGTYTLASGNVVRITPYAICAAAPDGTTLREIDTQQIISTQRNGQAVMIRLRGGETVTFTAASLDTAGRIESHLRPAETIVKEYKGLRPSKTYQKDVAQMAAAGWEVVNVATLSIPFPGRIVVTYRRH